MSERTPVVFVVDDDVSVRESVEALIETAGLRAKSFATALDFLGACRDASPSCLVLDVSLPGLSGLDLQQRLGDRRDLPIIFLTGHGDIPMSVQAMKAGAVDFLTKPVRDQTLLDAVAAGIEKDIAQRSAARLVNQYVDRYGKLTPREREVLREVVNGRLNKQIAFELGISEITVKLHRSNATKKMQATSVGQLIRIWEQLPASIRQEKLVLTKES